MVTKAQLAEREEAREKLREMVRPGDTVYTILRHVSRSGMSRSIDVELVKDGEVLQITYWASKAMGDRIDQNHGGIVMGGCGMDMGFALVYNLSHVLYPDGFDCVGDHCPSNDHSNPPHPKREAGSMHHKSGGYALKHRWL